VLRAKRELKAELRGWKIGLACLGLGLIIARILIGDDYGTTQGGEARSGPHDQVVFLMCALCFTAYWARHGFLWAAYQRVWDDYRTALSRLPTEEQEAALAAFRKAEEVE
jgi:hypothetical protein